MIRSRPATREYRENWDSIFGKKDVRSCAIFLAGEHVREDEGVQLIFWKPAADEVRLIEVTSSVADCGDFLPLRMAPDPPDIPYHTVIVLLSPGDWARREQLSAAFVGDDLEKLYPG